MVLLIDFIFISNNVQFNRTTSAWGTCSVTCGLGVQLRTVTCTLNGVAVSESFCDSAKPATSKSCILAACPHYKWKAGAWSTCSVTCGSGVKTRTVNCVQVGTNTVVDKSLCMLHNKPSPAKVCRPGPCPGCNW